MSENLIKNINHLKAVNKKKKVSVATKLSDGSFREFENERLQKLVDSDIAYRIDFNKKFKNNDSYLLRKTIVAFIAHNFEPNEQMKRLVGID